MGLFSNSFRQLINGKLSSAKGVITNSNATSIFSAVNKLKSRLSTTSGATDSIFSALSLDADFIDDRFITDSIVSYDEAEPTLSHVGEDVQQALIAGFTEACSNGGYNRESLGITLTDASGRAYNVFDHTNDDIIVDGYKVLFSSTMYVSKPAEGIILQDPVTGEVFLNNFIRTANFVGAEPERVRPDNLVDLLKSAILITGGDIPQGSTIMDLFHALYGGEPFPTIDRYVTMLCYSYNITRVGTILNDMLQVWDLLNEMTPLVPGQGSIQPIWSVMKDSIESSALNDFMLKACEIVLHPVNAGTSMASLATEASSSRFKSIRKFSSGTSSAFARGGVYGAGMYIISYIKSLTSSVVNDDGLMTFTDNSVLTPRIYIAGLISTIATSIATVVGVIVSIFAKVAGAALMIVGQAATSIIQAISYDYSSTNAALNTSENVILPTAPYGVYQCQLPYYQVSNADMKSLMKQGEMLQYMEIPGGFLFAGPGAYDSEGNVISYNFEIHPSLVDGTEVINYVVEYMILHNMFDFEYFYREVDRQSFLDASIRYDDVDLADFRRYIAGCWAEYVKSSTVSNQPNEHLSDSDDEAVRRILQTNLSIMGLFLGTWGFPFFHFQGNAIFITQTDDSSIWIPENTSSSDQNVGLWKGILSAVNPYTREPYEVDIDAGEEISYKLRLGSTLAHSWAQLSTECIDELNSDQGYAESSVKGIVNDSLYYDSINTFPENIQHSLFIPRYDKASFWFAIAITVAITALTAVAVTVATFAVKKAVSKKRSLNQARVAQAYDALSEDPSDENYAAYRKAVKKNNLWANLIGGSKFDMESYWNGATNDSEGASSGDAVNPLSGFGGLLADYNNDDQSADLASNQSESSQDLSTDKNLKIIRLIAGPSPL